jgi:hypothetical protein
MTADYNAEIDCDDNDSLEAKVASLSKRQRDFAAYLDDLGIEYEVYRGVGRKEYVAIRVDDGQRGIVEMLRTLIDEGVEDIESIRWDGAGSQQSLMYRL